MEGLARLLTCASFALAVLLFVVQDKPVESSPVEKNQASLFGGPPSSVDYDKFPGKKEDRHMLNMWTVKAKFSDWFLIVHCMCASLPNSNGRRFIYSDTTHAPFREAQTYSRRQYNKGTQEKLCIVPVTRKESETIGEI